MKRLIFYYDIVCPYAYIASARVDALVPGVEVEWTPILLGGVFRAIGAPDVPAEQMPPPKALLNVLDARRYAKLYGLPLDFPPPGHPRRTVEAMRLLTAAQGEARKRLTRALYEAYFVKHQDPFDRAVLAEACRAAEVDPALVSRIDEQATKDALRAATDAAVKDGVFGVPGFVVVRDDQRRLYWGQDRMHFVQAALS
jgi:2-hydroxychromene-2-carboxylate isomerase